jgi:hypothetical protein
MYISSLVRGALHGSRNPDQANMAWVLGLSRRGRGRVVRSIVFTLEEAVDEGKIRGNGLYYSKS